MGIASASITICIRDEDPLPLAEALFCFLTHWFIQPKSVEIHLPGRKFEKVEGSIDGNLFWGKNALPASLPGEVVLAGTDFTTLRDPENWLTLPRDLSQIMERLTNYSAQSSQLWQAKQTMHDQVYCTFWGLCKLAYKLGDSKTQEGFLLRQKLHRAGCLVPILRVSCNITRFPRPELSIKLLSHSVVWSRYTSDFDTAKQEWIAKTDLEVERRNASILANTFSSFVLQYPSAEVEWEHEQQHSPELRGFVTSELQTRLGAAQTPQRVRSLTIL